MEPAIHGLDPNQRFAPPSFTATSTGLSVTAPASATLAPPGHYMLVVLNGQDTPSEARIIQLS